MNKSAETQRVEETRALFEERMFNAYFINSIVPNPDPNVMGAVSFVPGDDMTKDELCKRSENDPETYEREEVSAMWFGWKAAVKNLVPPPEAESVPTQPDENPTRAFPVRVRTLAELQQLTLKMIRDVGDHLRRPDYEPGRTDRESAERVLQDLEKKILQDVQAAKVLESRL